jgi:hypothetical protein
MLKQPKKSASQLRLKQYDAFECYLYKNDTTCYQPAVENGDDKSNADN